MRVLVIIAIFMTTATAAQNPVIVMPNGHTDIVSKAFFSPDGKYLLTTSSDGTIKLWDVRSGDLLRDHRLPRSKYSAGYFIHSGESLLLSGYDSTYLIDTRSGKVKGRIKGITWRIKGKPFDPLEKILLTSTNDSTVNIWDMRKLKLADSIRVPFIEDARLNHSGTKILVRSRGYANLYNTAGDKLITLSDSVYNVSDAAFTSDDQKLVVSFGYRVTVSPSGSRSVRSTWPMVPDIRLYNTATWKESGRISNKNRELTDPYFTLAGKDHLLAKNISNDNLESLIDLRTLETLWQRKQHPNYYYLRSLDAETMIDAKLGSIWYPFKDSSYSVYDKKKEIEGAVLSPDKTALLVYGRSIDLFDRKSMQKVLSFEGHSQTTGKMKFLPGTNLMWQAPSNLWDLQTNRLISATATEPGITVQRTIEVNEEGEVEIVNGDGSIHTVRDFTKITRIGLTDDGNHLIYGNDLWLILRNTSRLTERRFIVEKDSINYFKPQTVAAEEGVVFKAAGANLTVEMDYSAFDWVVLKKEGERIFSGFIDEVQHVSISNDGKFAFITDDNPYAFSPGYVRILYDVEKKEIAATVNYPQLIHDAKFTPSNDLLIGTEDGVVFWDAKKGRKKFQVEGILPEDSGGNIFSPDGRSFLTTGFGELKTWDIENGKPLVSYPVGSEEVKHAAYSPDGKSIFSVHGDNATRKWNTHTGKLVATYLTIDSSDYLVTDAQGYYLSSPGGSKKLHYVDEALRKVGFEQLDIRYNRPDKVLKNLGVADTLLVSSYQKAYQKRIKKLGVDTTTFVTGFQGPEADFAQRHLISAEQRSSELKLQITGFDKAYPLDRLNVWINESPVFGSAGIKLKSGSRRIDTTVTITLSQGPNVIETSVINKTGVESYRMPLRVNYKPQQNIREKTYFIGIGINQFSEPGHDLNWSVKDIRDLATSLQEKYGSNIQIDTLFDTAVTRENVEALKKRLQQATENDKVIVSYSGHGLLSQEFDYYLSTYLVNFEKPEENGLPYEVLEGLLDGIAPRKKLMLIDACHSGEVDKEEMEKYVLVEKSLEDSGTKSSRKPVPADGRLGMKNSFELMQELFVNVGRSTGATIISAAAGTQFAQEKADLQNGVFTYSILEYMKMDPSATVTELRNYVNKRVTELTNGMQVPTTRSETKAVDWNVW